MKREKLNFSVMIEQNDIVGNHNSGIILRVYQGHACCVWLLGVRLLVGLNLESVPSQSVFFNWFVTVLLILCMFWFLGPQGTWGLGSLTGLEPCTTCVGRWSLTLDCQGNPLWSVFKNLFLRFQHWKIMKSYVEIWVCRFSWIWEPVPLGPRWQLTLLGAQHPCPLSVGQKCFIHCSLRPSLWPWPSRWHVGHHLSLSG